MSEEDTTPQRPTTIFGSNGPPHPRGGKVALAVEEGMIRNIVNRVTSDGIGAFDVELGDSRPWGRSSTRSTRGSPTYIRVHHWNNWNRPSGHVQGYSKPRPLPDPERPEGTV